MVRIHCRGLMRMITTSKSRTTAALSKLFPQTKQRPRQHGLYQPTLIFCYVESEHTRIIEVATHKINNTYVAPIASSCSALTIAVCSS